MKTNRLFVLFVVAALLMSTLACSVTSLVGGNPTASNFYMATENTGSSSTTTYSANQDFYVFFSVSDIPSGTQFEAKWYALDSQGGQNASVPFQTTDYTYQSGVSQVYFQLTNSGGWPTGHYKVEVYMNGAKVGEQDFSVQ